MSNRHELLLRLMIGLLAAFIVFLLYVIHNEESAIKEQQRTVLKYEALLEALPER